MQGSHGDLTRNGPRVKHFPVCILFINIRMISRENKHTLLRIVLHSKPCLYILIYFIQAYMHTWNQLIMNYEQA